jgi:hypothetical protein
MQLKVAHKSSMLQKTRAHSATIAEKNAAIKKLKQEAAGFHEMYFEMVDEVDDAHKYAQDMVKDSVKEIHLSKKCTKAAKRIAVGRLEKWKYWKAKYYDVLHVMELERENYGDSLDHVEETLKEQVRQKDILIMSLHNDLDEAVEEIVVSHCATATVQLSGVLKCKLSCAVALISMLSIIILIRNKHHIQ